MEGKMSFLLYCDLIHSIKELSDEQAGKLLKIILEYVNDKSPVIEDQILRIAFTPIKLSLKRDLETWRKTCEKNSKNGSKGGRPTKENPKQPKQPTGLIGNPLEPKKPDSDKDSDRDNDKDIITINNIEIIDFSRLGAKTFRQMLIQLYNLEEFQFNTGLNEWLVMNTDTEFTNEKHLKRSLNLYLNNNSAALKQIKKERNKVSKILNNNWG
jgi:hypothetical protein